MPKYFFHVQDGTASPDPDAIELKDLADAKCAAVKMAGRIICDSSKEFWSRSEWQMTVSDENDLTLFTLDFVGIEAPASLTRVHSTFA
jgi:hypothetical protein